MTNIYNQATKGQRMRPIVNDRFYVSDNYIEIYETTARKTPYGNWEVDTGACQITRDGYSVGDQVNRLVMQARNLQVHNRVKKLLVNPVMALMLVDEQILSVQHFGEALMRSLGYFDLPVAQFCIDLPVRVAQCPTQSIMLATERGYPVL